MSSRVSYLKFLRFHIFLFLLITPFVSLYAASDEDGTATIKGYITTLEGKPAASVTVVLKGTKRYSITGDDGVFQFKNIQAGNYNIEASVVGYQTIMKEVSATDGETTEAWLTLNLSAQQLREIIITYNRYRLVKRESDYVAKIPLKNLENPQVYSTITSALIRQQLLFSVDEATRNAPGLQKMWEAKGRSGDGGAIYNSRGFLVQAQLRNGIGGNVTSRIDAANLESIEVIKGPSATLFGSTLTSYGGLINRITKKPYEKFGGEITYATGNYNFNRLAFDVNTPLDSAKNILFRLNAAYNYEGSFQDNGFEKGYVLAPSFSLKVNDRLSFLFDAEIYRVSNTTKQVVFFYYPTSQLNATTPAQLGIDYNRSYTANDIFQESENNNFFGQMNYKLSKRWRSQTNFSSSNNLSNGPDAYLYVVPNSVVTGNASATGADYVARADQHTSNSADQVIAIQQNFMGDVNIAGLRNRLVGGIDVFIKNSNQAFYGVEFDTIKKNGNIPGYANFNRDNLNYVLQNTTPWTYPLKYRTNTYSAYVSDVINITDNFLATAAIRLNYFTNKASYSPATNTYGHKFNQTTFSPKFGLVYQPVTDKIAIFANFQNGFTNMAGIDFKGIAFNPEEATQLEGGIKLNALRGKLNGTISYYNIKVHDLVRADPTHPNFYIQDGTQLSKGIEAEIIANPARGLNVIAGFAYNDSRFEKADADVQGRRPATAMSPYSANLWLSYSFRRGKAKGLGFGFGGNYASDNKVVNSAYYGVFTLPEYVILNATVYYDRPKYRMGFKVDNLTNKEYWIGYTTMNPQKLRSVVGSISFKF